MSSDERNGGGRPRKDSPSSLAIAIDADSAPPEISSRGRIVIRSSSHPPGETPPYSDPPPVSTPPTGRVKRDTPAERPRKRREARAMSVRDSDPTELGPRTSSVPPQIAGAADRGTLVLWTIIAVLSAALAYALLR